MTIEIKSNLDAHDVTVRLQRLLERSRDPTGRFPTLIGRVQGSQVEVMRTVRFGNSIFRPQLVATISPSAPGTNLIGEFRLSVAARSVVRLWYGSVSGWLALSMLAAAVSRMPVLWYMPLAGLVLLLLGAAFIRLAKSYYSDDKEWLIRLITEELQGTTKVSVMSANY